MSVAPPAETSTGLADRWNRFWYAEGSAFSLGVFRALFAICLAFELPVTRSVSVFAIQGGFHLPYFSFWPLVTPETYHLIHDLQYPFIFLLGLGIFTRVSAGVLLGLQGLIYFADQLNFRNHPYLFLLLLLMLVFSPAGKAFSVPAAIGRLLGGKRSDAGATGAVAPLTIQRLIQVQISIVYFFAALHKMTAQFLGGSVLADVIGKEIVKGPVGDLMAGLLSPASFEAFKLAVVEPGFWVFAAWATVILELLLPFALWVPRWRVAAMAFGVPFHLIIGFTMKIHVFSAVMISSYLLFLDPATLPALWSRLRGATALPPNPSSKAAKRQRRR